MREIRYLAIGDRLRARIEAGEFDAGHLLPSESTLCAEHGASRATVRKALESLRDEGLVDSRQGFGWFVATEPLRQSLGRLGTIEAQLEASGSVSERQILDFEMVEAPPRVKHVLRVDRVLQVRRRNLADGRPFARVTVWCPEVIGRSLSLDDVEARPFYELLPVEIGGATQTIAAAAADSVDADLLDIPVGAPVLVCERVTHDVRGEPVLVGVHVFPSHLTEFVVDLPHAPASIAPTGLRLVT